MKPRNLAIIAAALTAASAWAIPARPVWRTVQQPDGSTVTLKLVGDEYSHHYVTTDGMPVLRADGGYFFVNLNADGTVHAGDMLASNPERRSVEQSARLASIDRVALDHALERRADISILRAKAPALAAYDNGSNGIGLYPDASFPLVGEAKSIVILVAYADLGFELSDEETHDYFYNMLNQEGFSDLGGTGSSRDYFIDSSNGVFQPTFDVYGPVTLPNNRAYYGGNNSQGNDLRPHQMIVHACEILKETVDFSQYDLDGDGKVDNVYVYYAGEGEAQSDVADAVWPHSWNVSYGLGNSRGYSVGDNIYVDRYACSNELLDDTLDGIGTFTHEFSHVMGLPDLYNTNTVTYDTPSEYDVMDQGSYNNNSRTPPTYSLFERSACGWANLIPITESFNMQLENLADSNTGYLLETQDPKEFFLFENRQKDGWDKYLPGHGMLVWHIDYDRNKWLYNTVNNDKSHQRVDLVEACNRTYSTITGEKRYPFPGPNNVSELTSETKPALVDWNGNSLEVAFHNIAETNGVITAHVVVGDDGIISIEAGAHVKVDGRTITTDSDITVTDMLGRRIAQGRGTLTLPASGLYIVTTPTSSHKLHIR